MRNGKSKVALVAGGAGFLGSHLCDVLIGDGFKVVCLDSFTTGRRCNLDHLGTDPGLDVVEHDIIADLPPMAKPDVIYNLACAASPPHYQADPEHTLMTNVVGTRNLLKLAEQTGARFVQASTSEVYGDPDVHPQVESYWGNVNPTGPRACYDEGKRAAEALIFDYDRLKRADVRVARIFNTYGPRMRDDDGRVVSNAITQAIGGEDITIYGDGGQTRSFCYVDDLVEGLVRLMSHEGTIPGPINLGNPTEVSVNGLVEIIVRMTGSSSPVVRLPLPTDDPRRRRPDISLARKTLGWAPKVALERGLDQTIDYFDGVRRHAIQNAPATLVAAAR